MSKAKRIPCLITTDHEKRGVFMGYVDQYKDLEYTRGKDKDPTVFAYDVRMCVYWSEEVKGVLGLASHGPDKNSRVTRILPRSKSHPFRLEGVTAIVQITSKAEKAWKKEPWG